MKTLLVSRRWAAFWLVWSVAFGGFATRNLARTHEHKGLYLAGAILHLVTAAFYAHRLWGDR